MNSSDGQLTLMKVRLLAGMTQKEFADLLGVTVKTVSSWERGVQEPRLSFWQVQQILKASNLSIDDLVEAYEGTQLERSKKGGDANVKT